MKKKIIDYFKDSIRYKGDTTFGFEITGVKFKDGTTWDRSIIK